MPICWMCNKNEAITGEHIFKHSILRAMYGRSRLDKGNRLIILEEKNHNGRIVHSKKYIDSTDSEKLKFEKTLCAHCNGAKSKAWDEEVDIFANFLFDNWQSYLKNGYINLNELGCSASRVRVRNLYNYFCKLFGCLLFSIGQPIPKEIIDAVNGRNYKNSLGINIVFDVGLEKLTDLRYFLVNHEIISDPGNELNYRWALGFGPLKIAFWFCTPLEFSIGQNWFGKSKYIPFVKNI